MITMPKTRTATTLQDLKRQTAAIMQQAESDNGFGFNTETMHETGALHEVAGAGYQDRAAALGFSIALAQQLLAHRPGPLVWCQKRQRQGDPEGLRLHAPGLLAFGVDPSRITQIFLDNEQDLLWALEEALDCSCLAGAIGVLWSEKIYGFTASRRLALRAKKSGVTGILLRPHRTSGLGGTTAAATRWRVSSAPGKTRWQLDLTRCRNGKPGQRNIGWDHETVSFDMASRLADRAGNPQIWDQQPAKQRRDRQRAS